MRCVVRYFECAKKAIQNWPYDSSVVWTWMKKIQAVTAAI